MVTGDNPVVAARVCRDLGLLAGDGGGVLQGGELDAMDDEALELALRTTVVLARVSPERKARIVRVARGGGGGVALLGDGVNDALALHAADVGISVDSATDVAKDAADVILLEKDLGVLADGVVEGRRIFANTMKYVLMGTSSNVGNMVSAAAASVFLGFLPMLPSQILLNNLLYDTSQLAIPTDGADPEQLQRPAHWDLAFIRKFMLFFGPLSSVFDLVTFAVMLWVFHSGPEQFRSGWFVESLATQTLVIFAIRTRRVPFFRSHPSLPLTVSALAVVAVGNAIPATPFARALGFQPLPGADFAALAGMVVGYLLLVELGKTVFYRASRAPTSSRRWFTHHHHLRRRAAYFSSAGPDPIRREQPTPRTRVDEEAQRRRGSAGRARADRRARHRRGGHRVGGPAHPDRHQPRRRRGGVFLLLGVLRGARPPDAAHPLGHGRERFFWSFVAAAGIFVGGVGAAAAETVRAVLHPEPTGSYPVGYAVLAVVVALDAVALVVAVRPLAHQADARHLTVARSLWRGTDPAVSTVVLSSAAGLLGGVVAAVGLSLREATGSAAADVVARATIAGVLLVTSGLLLHTSRELLTGRGVAPRLVEAMRVVVAGQRGVVGVPDLFAAVVGPESLVISGDVIFDDDLDVPQVERAIVAAASALRRQWPGVVYVYLNRVAAPRPRRRSADAAARAGDVRPLPCGHAMDTLTGDRHTVVPDTAPTTGVRP